MRVSDHSIAEMTIDIADGLSDRWCTDMRDMEGFSSIGTDIVDDDRRFYSPLRKGDRGISLLSFLRRQESCVLFF